MRLAGGLVQMEVRIRITARTKIAKRRIRRTMRARMRIGEKNLRRKRGFIQGYDGSPMKGARNLKERIDLDIYKTDRGKQERPLSMVFCFLPINE